MIFGIIIEKSLRGQLFPYIQHRFLICCLPDSPFRNGNYPEIMMFEIFRYLSKCLPKNPFRSIALNRAPNALAGHETEIGISIFLMIAVIKNDCVLTVDLFALPVNDLELPVLPEDLQGHLWVSPRSIHAPGTQRPRHHTVSLFLPLLRLFTV